MYSFTRSRSRPKTGRLRNPDQSNQKSKLDTRPMFCIVKTPKCQRAFLTCRNKGKLLSPPDGVIPEQPQRIAKRLKLLPLCGACYRVSRVTRSARKQVPVLVLSSWYWYYRISKKWIILSGSELFYRILLLICAENFIQNKNLKKLNHQTLHKLKKTMF